MPKVGAYLRRCIPGQRDLSDRGPPLLRTRSDVSRLRDRCVQRFAIVNVLAAIAHRMCRRALDIRIQLPHIHWADWIAYAP
jgi:hypothetical protein